jgi:hypothetical protein
LRFISQAIGIAQLIETFHFDGSNHGQPAAPRSISAIRAVAPRVISPERKRTVEKAPMDAWFHCEKPYPFVSDAVLDATDSVRASLTNRYCDPQVAGRLFEETLDEYLLCDELGLNITSSEHHSRINCLYGASPVVLGILARQTRKIAN